MINIRVNGTTISLENSNLVTSDNINNQYKSIESLSNQIDNMYTALRLISNVKAVESFGYISTESVSESIKAGANKVWEAIKNFVKKIKEVLKRFFKWIKEKINKLIDRVLLAISKSKIIPEKIKNATNNIRTKRAKSSKESLNGTLNSDEITMANKLAKIIAILHNFNSNPSESYVNDALDELIKANNKLTSIDIKKASDTLNPVLEVKDAADKVVHSVYDTDNPDDYNDITEEFDTSEKLADAIDQYVTTKTQEKIKNTIKLMKSTTDKLSTIIEYNNSITTSLEELISAGERNTETKTNLNTAKDLQSALSTSTKAISVVLNKIEKQISECSEFNSLVVTIYAYA